MIREENKVIIMEVKISFLIINVAGVTIESLHVFQCSSLAKLLHFEEE